MDQETTNEKLLGKEPFSTSTGDEDNVFIREATDVPQFYLRGTVPGAKSDAESEDPNFSLIRGVDAPIGAYFTDEERVKQQDASMARYETDPHYRGVVDGFLAFIIGRGFQVTPEDENPEVKEYINAFMEASKFDGKDREIVSKVLRAGEVFVRFFVTAGEKVARVPVIKILNYWNIRQVVVDPENTEIPLAYVRKYLKDGEVQTENIPADQVLHIKICDSDQVRGRPMFAVIVQHCQYYLDWLFNRIVLNRLKTAYYLEEIVDGTPSRVSTQDSQATDQHRTSKTGQLIKRMPKPGSKLVHNKSVEYKWLKPEVGGDDASPDGRAIRLAIASGAQCPEFLMGDASNANLASTLVSQNPFVRKVEFLQDAFEAHFKQIFKWVIQYGVQNKFIPAKSVETVAAEKSENVRVWRRFKARVNTYLAPGLKKIQSMPVGTVLKEQLDASGNAITQKVIDTKTSVNINWPPLIAQDSLKDAQTYQMHQAIGVVSDRTLAEKLGYDYDQEQTRMEQEKADQPEDAFGDEERDEAINSEGKDDESPEKPGEKKPAGNPGDEK